MTITQQLITVLMVVIGTVITRALPFILIPLSKNTPEFIKYLGKFLPGAVFALLVVYCLKNVSFVSGTYGLPEFFALTLTVILHLWKRKMLLSIAGGTVLYMIIIQIFV